MDFPSDSSQETNLQFGFVAGSIFSIPMFSIYDCSDAHGQKQTFKFQVDGLRFLTLCTTMMFTSSKTVCEELSQHVYKLQWVQKIMNQSEF